MRRRSRDLVCQQLVEKVSAYLDGELRDRDRVAVERHLAECDHCRGYVEQVRTLLQITADSAGAAELPDDLVEDLVSQFRARR